MNPCLQELRPPEPIFNKFNDSTKSWSLEKWMTETGKNYRSEKGPGSEVTSLEISPVFKGYLDSIFL